MNTIRVKSLIQEAYPSIDWSKVEAARSNKLMKLKQWSNLRV